MSQTTTPSGAESNSRAAFEHFMSNAGANPEAIERAFYTYKQAKSANYFHVWSYCWSVREETVAALIARNAELEAERDALAAERDKQQDTSREWAQRASALAAENKALREALEHIQGLHSHDKAVFQLAAHCYDAKTIADEALARTPAKENDDG